MGIFFPGVLLLSSGGNREPWIGSEPLLMPWGGGSIAVLGAALGCCDLQVISPLQA